MASIINAATSGGLVTTADTSGVLQLQTASTTAVTVNASQNVGIGTASPGARLGILVSGMTNQVSLGANASNSAYGSMSFGASNLDTGRIGFTAGGNTDLNLYVDVPSGGTHQFRNATTTMVTVNSAGNLKTIGTISVGNATPSTSGAGITFPASQSASSDPQTLDDYEEGTFTPAVTGSTTNPTVSYNWRYGYYTKIGNQVTLWFGYNVSSISSAGSGDLRVTIPFTSSNRVDNRIPGTVGGGVSYTAGSVLTISNAENTAYITFRQFNSTPSSSVLSVSSLNGSSESVQMCITITVD